jgi:hypothetical protein
MKVWKITFITMLAFFAVGSIVLYSSCERDACLDLKCRNGGACAEGYCRCKTGYEGAECEIMAADKFLGLYIGERTCVGSPVPDTVLIFLDDYPNKVKMVQFSRKEDTLSGTTGSYSSEGYDLNFEDYSRGNYRRHSSAKLSPNGFKNLSVYNEYVADVTVSNEKEVCNFLGRK